MKRLFKLLCLACALALTVLALSGCHGAPERSAFAIPEDFDADRTYEITFWAKNDTNKTQTDIYRQAIADFEALYPNIKVKLKLYTDYARIYSDVITNIPTETTPNVCITYPDHIATYLSGSNVVVPLDDLLDDARYGLGGSEVRFDSPAKSEIVPQFLGECAFRGHTYALPYMRSTEALYINKTYVEKLGYTVPDVPTWDFVWEVSEAAMAMEGDVYAVNGQTVLIPFIYKSTDNMMIQLLKQLDAPYSNDRGDVLLMNEVTREQLKIIAGHARTGAFSTFGISSYPANFLNAGQCIFAVDSTAGATWMGSDAPLLDISADNIVKFETVVRPIPQVDPAHPAMISQGPSVCVFNKADPQEVLASWLFAQYLLTNDVQIAYAQTEGYVPVTLKAQQSPEYQDYVSRAGEDNKLHYAIKLQAAQLLRDYVDCTFVTPVFAGSASLRDAAGSLIEAVCKAERKGTAVDDAYIDKLYTRTVSNKHLDQIGGFGASTDVRVDLGPLPGGSVALLIALGCVWLGLGAFALRRYVKNKKTVK